MPASTPDVLSVELLVKRLPSREPALAAHDVHQESSKGLHVRLDVPAAGRVLEEDAVQIGEVLKRDENFVGRAIEVFRYHIATIRIPGCVAIVANSLRTRASIGSICLACSSLIGMRLSSPMRSRPSKIGGCSIVLYHPFEGDCGEVG
jgi:hypothetical protein